MGIRSALLGLMFTVVLAAAVWAEIPPGTRADMFLKSEHAVMLDTFADRGQVRPGEEFTLALRITPFQNDEIHFHTYSDIPSDDWSYQNTIIMMDEAEGVTWGDVIFPEPIDHDGTLWIPHGSVVTVTGALAEDFAPGAAEFTAQYLISLCTESMCLEPSQGSLSWGIEVVPADFAGEIAVTPLEELTAYQEIDYGRFNLPEMEGEIGGGLDLTGGDGEAANGTASTTSGGLDLENVKTDSGTDWPLWKVLLFALLGGLILNVMPCVLPVVSIKVIDLVSSSGKDSRHVIGHGFAFAAGIIATFLLGALVIAAIQAFGTQLGWGSQFQSPGFVLVMSTIIFVFGLSLADVFKIKAADTVKEGAGGLAEKEGLGGSFFKGVLATVLGTPCVGPFLGPALIVAFAMMWYHTVLIFGFVGIGMALPYLIMLPFITRLSKRDRGRLSRKIQGSKDWLNDFKMVMAFVLFATVIYLLYIMEGVLGGKAVIWALGFLVGVGFAAWLWGRLVNLGRKWVALAWVGAIVIVLLSGWFTIPRIYAAGDTHSAGALDPGQHAGWEVFSREALVDYTREGKTVLVDFTADWCPNCKTNEAVALNIPETMALKDELGMVFMVADWTAKDDEIGDTLRALGFASVPLTAIFPGDNPNEPILLDGLFGPAGLHDAMRRAAGGGE